jgi:hypothetical protein
MKTSRTKKLLIAIGFALAAANASPAIAQCCGEGWSLGGCSRIGGSPTLSGYCSGGYGDCYQCEYNCYSGDTVSCAETADGSVRRCGRCYDKTPPTDCPVLVDLDTNGFHLEGLSGAVLFDLNASGVPKYYSWTRAHGRDAFLCRDLDGNGHIENGQELFGTATVLLNGAKARHGYEALEELDLFSQGGNEDGRLTADDSSFQQLCVWADENHNGISDPGEVLSLEAAGVMELSYDFHETRRRDAYGNEFRYHATVTLKNPQGKPHHSSTYDVFLLSR